MIKMESRNKSQYFDYSEARETIDKKPFELKLEAIRTYRYETGGVYHGCWMGNLRHGPGEMKWSNGATYQGNW